MIGINNVEVLLPLAIFPLTGEVGLLILRTMFIKNLGFLNTAIREKVILYSPSFPLLFLAKRSTLH